MTPDQWFKVKTVVQEALEMEPGERARFLAERCGEDDLLRSEAAALLRASENVGDFIEAPPAVKGFAIEKTALLPAKLPPGSSIGRYTVETLIGEGGMGEVYLASDPRLKRKVAVKVLPATLAADEERFRRFEQ
jgi:serine/threonine-protein kinase